MAGVDPHMFLPRDKFDCNAAKAVIALGYPVVGPVLRELLKWLQDCNWPVSRPIGDFLATLPEPMAPFIWEVLRGDDHVWKYWCIVRLIRVMPPAIAGQFREELTRLAEHPTGVEQGEELDVVSRGALDTVWPSGHE